MDTEMGETGDGADEVKHAGSELGGAKLNGDMNGAYEDEPMDISDSADTDRQQSPVKKISSVSGCNSDNTIGDEDTDNEKHSESVGGKDVPNSEVPKNEQKDSDERVSSNGFSHYDDDNVAGSDNSRAVSSMDCDDDDAVDADFKSDEKNESRPPKVSDVGNNGLTDNKDDKSVNSDSVDRKKDNLVNIAEKPEISKEGIKNEVKQEFEDEEDYVMSPKDDEDSCSQDASEGFAADKLKENAHESKCNDDTDGEVEDGDKLDSSIIELDSTPEKCKKKPPKSMPINVTPRRSSRNLNKQKSYIEKDEKDVPFEEEEEESEKTDDPDIEEIQPQDPLADIPTEKPPILPKSLKKTTIVVNDTKRLAEIAAGSKNTKGGKKEPTLVIIDTNSILSGRGPVPLASQHQSVLNTGTPLVAGPSRSQNPSYSVLPITIPAQGMYTSPPNMRPSQASIKPIPIPQAPTIVPAPKPPIVLPSLTDDMYVVEAPSFIVPYVYEKPPIKPLKEYVEKLEEMVKEIQAKLEQEKKEREEKEKKEKEEKEKEEKEKETDEDEKSIKEEDKSKEKVNDDKAEKSADAVVKMEVDEEDTEQEKKSDENKTKDKASEEEEDEDKPKDLTKDKTDKEKDKESDSTSQENDGAEVVTEKKKPTNSYFDNALGKFFMQIGINLVQEHVQTDLLRSQKRKRDREGNKCAPDVHMAINSLMRTLEFSKENNEPFKMELKKCEFCSFKTESQLVMAHHLETPHMRNYVYRCNFCTLEVRSPHDILFHMEAEHNVRGRLERAPAFHQCPSCPFEDNQKGKLTRHLLSCAKKYRPERNQEPPLDWEPPAKIPRVPRNRPSSMGPGSALYQAAMSGLKQGAAQVAHPLLPKLMPTPNTSLGQGILNRGRGRPQLANRYIPDFRSPTAAIAAQQKAMAAAQMRPGMVYRPSGTNSQPQVLLPTSYQIAGNQIYQVVGNQGAQGQVPIVGGAPRLAFVPPNSAQSPTPTPVALVPNIAANSNSITIQSSTSTVSSSTGGNTSSSASSKQSGSAAAKLLQQPSISITPLPRQQPSTQSPTSSSPSSSSSLSPASSAAAAQGKPGRPLGSGKATFVICEICDGYIKDLELLRNHMQWIHKVKIHPKMIYNRPPLNCQKCQFRFFTDQGLERHLLGSHGLVTSSMQEAANKGKDGGRCPVCGRVYQWKLLNHVARDHNMSLKPAHLSYKCTVCTATFGMYKQFENHVYSAHSVVAKRVMDKKAPNSTQQPSTSASQGDSLLKPLKINDEITIIPQPPRSSKTKTGGPTTRLSSGSTGNGSSSSNANSSSSNKGKV